MNFHRNSFPNTLPYINKKAILPKNQQYGLTTLIVAQYKTTKNKGGGLYY
jgi:hypothetical protein